MSGLSLSKAASYFRGDVFAGWNPVTDTFEDTFVGRLFIIDRFKSIYNKPTRRQKMTFPADVEIPESKVIMREQDEEIFLVSDLIEREFWKGGDNYDNVATLQRVNSVFGGKALFYPAETSGTDDDLGFVSVDEEGPVYADLEFKTTAEEDGTLNVDVNHGIVTYSQNVEAEPGDYFLIGDKYHRVVNTYVDSGLLSARTVEEDPNYVECVYEMQVESSPTYNPATGVVDSGVEELREVSCLIGRHRQRRDLAANIMQNTMEVYIYKRHIGFDPELGDRLTIKDTRYRVEEIEYSTLELQWKLLVSV